jgi:hypothetical protein
MKQVFGLLSLIVLFSLTSCSSKDITTPVQDVFYSDNNITVTDFQAVYQSDNNIKINFSTLHLSGVNQIEIMSSGDDSRFCTRKIFEISSNQDGEQSFIFVDEELKGEEMFYMLRFRNAQGSWTYTNVISVQLSL